MKYLHWNEKIITDFSVNNIESMYENGYVFTRIDKGVMHQTRSLRLKLNDFELSSENRRILKKVSDLEMKPLDLPMKDYHFTIGKIAKDFYDTKFGPNIMSAQKIKEMLTNKDKSNFNLLLQYYQNRPATDQQNIDVSGFAICYSSPTILHYSYPFYDLSNCPKDMGLAMMLKAIIFAKETKRKYMYLGSLQRPSDVYKLQFSGLEWFDGKNWNTDIGEAKEILE